MIKFIQPKFLFLLLLTVFFTVAHAQNVGINATGAAPNASAILDVSSTDKGFLIPRIALTQTTSNAPIGAGIATSLLVYNTATINDVTPGFYFWNGTLWIRFQSNLDIDHDWYEVGTSTAPNAITDSMFHLGNTAIGKNTAAYRLDIDAGTSLKSINTINNNTQTGTKYGIHNSINRNNTEDIYGTRNDLTTNTSNSTAIYGTYDDFTSATESATVFGKYTHIDAQSLVNLGSYSGSLNEITSAGDNTGVSNIINNLGSAQNFGVSNDINSQNSTSYGIRNNIINNNAGTGVLYGTSNRLFNAGTGTSYGNYSYVFGTGAGLKFGSYDSISATSSGRNFGNMSIALDTLNDYTGYFRGKLSVGMAYNNNYIFPTTRGTNNQIMITDGNGVVTWQNASAVSAQDHDWYEVGTTTAPDAITDDMFHTGKVGIGTTNPSSSLQIDNATIDTTLKINNTLTNAGITNGIYLNMSNTTGSAYGINANINGNFGLGLSATLSGAGASNQAGIVSGITVSGNGQHQGTLNSLSGGGTGNLLV